MLRGNGNLTVPKLFRLVSNYAHGFHPARSFISACAAATGWCKLHRTTGCKPVYTRSTG